jgi:mxaA protein
MPMKLPIISMLLKFSPSLIKRVVMTIALVFSGHAFSAPPVTIEREDTRLFGYQLGDVITQKVFIGLAPGFHFDPQSLPKNGKRAGWFMVRSTHYDEQASADGSALGKLTIDMQLVNSPNAVRSLTIPPISLKFKGPQNLVETIPSLTIDAAPLATGDIRTGLPDALPPRPAQFIPTEDNKLLLDNLILVAGILSIWVIITLLIQRFASRKSKPFASANTDIRRLSRLPLSPEKGQALAQRVHRAFDQTAGYRLFRENIPAFCEQLNIPQELSLSTDAFFESSQRLFFREQSAEDAQALLSQFPKQVHDLVRAWKKFEAKQRI